MRTAFFVALLGVLLSCNSKDDKVEKEYHHNLIVLNVLSRQLIDRYNDTASRKFEIEILKQKYDSARKVDEILWAILHKDSQDK
jgi:hypothetical protein